MTQDQPTRTTTDAGAPVESDEHSLTVGPDSPVLLQDNYLIEQMAQFNRERIPTPQQTRTVARTRWPRRRRTVRKRSFPANPHPSDTVVRAGASAEDSDDL